MTSDRVIYVGIATNDNERPSPAGILKLHRRGVIESGEFAYGTRYLDRSDAVALNPLHLALMEPVYKLQERRLRDGGALPLTFRDALPDSWGMRVIAAQLGPMDEIDILLRTNADRVGAMVFSDSTDMPMDVGDDQFHDLDRLYEAIRRIEQSQELEPEFRRLILRGGTLGGARPKHTFIHEGCRWIAKFPADSDSHDVEVLEAATLGMASRCGINVPEHKLLTLNRYGHALLIKRFDRVGDISYESRRHYLSAAAILDAPYDSDKGSYVELAETLRKISVNVKKDLDQLYRRLIFNLIIDNTDDHVKNHGVLHVRDNRYELSPAFDMVCQVNNIGYQELAILLGRHESSLKLAIEAAKHFGLREEEAKAIIESIKRKVDQEFLGIVKEYGGAERLLGDVEKCLVRQWQLVNA